MNVRVSARAAAFRTGVFNELAAYKRKMLEQGKEIIDLSVGSPDLPPPPFIVETLVRHAQDPAQYGYTLTGTREFHEAVAAYYEQRFRVKLDPEREVLLLMGSQDGLVHLPIAFADPGDVVFVPDPGYPAYEAGVKLAGAEAYPLPLRREKGFLPDLEEIPTEIARRAKMMILNFPGNPVPAMATREFFSAAVRFAKEFDLLLVHDFAYSELVFDGRRPFSLLEIAGAKEVAVEFNSLSKSFNMAGCRIGYLTGRADVIEAFARFKSNLDYGVFLPVQKAAAVALRSGARFLAKNAKIYERRRDVLVEGLASLGWLVDRPPATMFVWAKVPEGWTSREFTHRLLNEAGVVVTPGDAFGRHGEGYVRIALVQPEEKLKQAVRRIAETGLLRG
ncbi:LL-diaminopimelate aminotransferase [Bacillaceae bacterium]